MVRKRTARLEEKLEEAFLELSQQDPDRSPTLFELVSAHREWIGKLVDRRHSYGAIAEAMVKKGVKISPNTLRQYYGKLERSDRQSIRTSSPKFKPLKKAAGSLATADPNSVEAYAQTQKVVQPTRFKPLLPGETEL